MTPNEHLQAAEDLLGAEASGEQIGLLTKRHPEMEMEDAYAVQAVPALPPILQQLVSKPSGPTACGSSGIADVEDYVADLFNMKRGIERKRSGSIGFVVVSQKICNRSSEVRYVQLISSTYDTL